MWTLTKFLVAGAIALIWFQNSAPNPVIPSSAKAPAETKATVPPSQPIITVHGVCEDAKATDTASCAAVITRERFENLVQALHPGQELPASARNNLGKLYAEYLTVEAATRKAGMEDTAEYHEFMNWMRVLAATEYYRRKLQAKYDNPPQAEIDAYYHQHLPEYERVKLERIMIPRENSLAANKDEFDKKALEAANNTHANLAKGMETAEAQKTAYAALGLPGPPPADLGTRRRKDFIDEESAEVFSLKPGEITKVYVEPRSYVIYKVLSHETVPEEDVKKFISGQITEKKFKDAMNAVLDAATVDLNEQYFGAPGPAPSEPPRSPHTMSSH